MTRGRLAPSPTGPLHLGHARTFLLAYWHARARSAELLLRLEDVDVERASPEDCRKVEEDLAWLGIEWDGAPRLQSEGLPRLRAAAERLLARGLAYPCVCTRGDLRRAAEAQGRGLEAHGAPQGEARELVYPGTCRGLYRSLEEAEAVSGRPAGLRFSVPPGAVSFEDGIHGHVTENVAEAVGDFLILRKGGAPSYQLAVVVDDAFDGITDVVRGDDLLPSTARQILLGRALGSVGLAAPEPAYVHLPLVLDDAGKRLAKRDAARSLAELRQQGVAASAIVAWAARSLGQAPDDVRRATAGEVVASFNLGRVPKRAALAPPVAELLR